MSLSRVQQFLLPLKPSGNRTWSLVANLLVAFHCFNTTMQFLAGHRLAGWLALGSTAMWIAIAWMWRTRFVFWRRYLLSGTTAWLNETYVPKRARLGALRHAWCLRKGICPWCKKNLTKELFHHDLWYQIVRACPDAHILLSRTTYTMQWLNVHEDGGKSMEWVDEVMAQAEQENQP